MCEMLDPSSSHELSRDHLISVNSFIQIYSFIYLFIYFQNHTVAKKIKVRTDFCQTLFNKKSRRYVCCIFNQQFEYFSYLIN